MTESSEQTAGKPCAGKLACTVWEGAVRNGQECTALAAYFTLISRHDSRFARLDAQAFASKNLWNAANYLVRQSFLVEHAYLDNVKVFHLIKSHEAYKALPAKVGNQVLIQLHKAWVSFFEAMKQWREHPEKFLGRPKLPTYKHKEHGRNLLVYEFKAISKRALKRGMISLTGLGELVKTNQTREHLKQVRIVPRATQYVIEVVYERAEQKADLDPTLFASIDLGVNNLAALTSNAGITPLLINGRPLKSINQGYNKARAALQRRLAKENRFTSPRLEQLTEKRNRRVHHSLHVASRRIIDLLVEHKIATLIVGLNPLWKQEVNMGKRINQSFVQIPHARFVAMLTYKAALVGITVKVTEEAYTSKASFLDQDELPLYDPTRQEKPHFSGRRISRGMYQAADKRLINADINASLNIGRKVVPTAFAGRGIVASAVRPRRLAV